MNTTRIKLAVMSDSGTHLVDRYVDEMSGTLLIAMIREAGEAGDLEAVAICETELARRAGR